MFPSPRLIHRAAARIAHRTAGLLLLALLPCAVANSQPTSSATGDTAWVTSGTVRVLRDVVYDDGTSTDSYLRERRKLDFIMPLHAPASLPLLVWFHGGGLEGGDKAGTDAIAQRFAERGVGMALANYRLSPRVHFPAYLEDAAAAVAFCVRNAERFGASPDRIFVGGHSAGGYLASMLATDAHYLKAAGIDETSIAGWIPMSGQMMTHFTVKKERGIPNERMIADDAAPLYHLRKDVRPMLVIMGDRDWPARLEENAYFVAAMTKVIGSTSVTLEVVPERDHGQILLQCLEPGDPAGEAMLKFMGVK